MIRIESAPPLPRAPDYRTFDLITSALDRLPEEFNPAIRLDYELTLLEVSGQLDLMTRIALRPQMERAIKISQQDLQRVKETVQILERLSPVPRRDYAPLGF